MELLKKIAGYKRLTLGILAMLLAALGAVPPEWRDAALGISGALTVLTKLIDQIVPSDGTL